MISRSIYRISSALATGTLLFIAACNKESSEQKSAEPEEKHETKSDVKATGKVITIEAYSDAQGNYFKPTEVEAHRGDIVRFVLKSGVHNINFLPDSNPGAEHLPATSDMLQLPEQAFDVLVAMKKGSYFFQCDPHALLGMVGRIKVVDD